MPIMGVLLSNGRSGVMRLFVAVELSDKVQRVLGRIQHSLRPRCDGVRWVPTHQLHLTLKFLGDVIDPDVPSACEAVSGAATAIQPFAMTLRGCGCFPGDRAVRVVWAGVDEPSGSLAACAAGADDALEAAGFERERRPFSPHITLGRLRQDRSDGAIRAAVEAFSFDAVEQTVKRITLMSSVLSSDGPTYVPVCKAALG